MRSLLLPLLLFLALHAFAQAPDLTFNGTGTATYDPTGQHESAFTLVITPDGPLLAGTAYVNGNSTMLLLALAQDGSVRTTFGTEGLLSIPGTGPNWAQVFLGTRTDGSVLVAAQEFSVMDGGDVLVYRVLANGTLDMTFGNGGSVVIDQMELDVIAGMVVRPDGGFAVLLRNNPGTDLMCFNATGQPMTNFGTAGLMHFPQLIMSLRNAGNGGLWLGGHTVIGGLADTWVARLQANGAYDNSFGTGGQASFQLDADTDENTMDVALDVQELADGGALVLVNVHGQAVEDGWPRLARITSTGALVTSFGNGGVVDLFNGEYTQAGKMVVEPDGRCVIASFMNSQLLMEKRTASGALQSNWGNGGSAITMPTNVSFYYLANLALDQAGHIVTLGGGGSTGGTQDFLVHRFTNDLVSIGLSEIDTLGDRLRAVPDPAEDHISIACNSTSSTHATVYDLLGRPQPVAVHRTEQGLTLAVGALAAGRYFVSILSDNGTRRTVPFHKQ